VAEDVRLSKRLAHVLRHAPHTAGLTLDAGGWVPVPELLAALGIGQDELDAVVRDSAKQRFAVVDGRIRAQQGHSVPVDLGHAATTPPDVLWHGTTRRALPAILREGLRRQQRHAVHLSADEVTARAVGARRGPAVVLRVDAAAMAAAGHEFSRSGNGVWLVEAVPPEHLSVG
jgi:putative RNA 2'-phosphotransferase